MIWNWQHKDWPNFKYDQKHILDLEKRFVKNNGILLGATKYLSKVDQNNLIVMLASNEALNTSEIEGEYLNRATRDLQELVEMQAFTKIGELKSTRYYIKLEIFTEPRIISS